MDNFYINTNVTLTFAVADEFGVAVDAATATIVTTDPSGSATTYTTTDASLTHSATGTYIVTFPPTVAGVWRCVGSTTGAYEVSTVYKFRALALS